MNTNVTYLWQNFGLARYARKNPAVKTYWVQTTPNRKTGPGFLSCRNVIKCILSFSASSSNVWIQPWSLCIRRSEWRCRTIAAVNPGTPKSRINSIFYLKSGSNSLNCQAQSSLQNWFRLHWFNHTCYRFQKNTTNKNGAFI